MEANNDLHKMGSQPQVYTSQNGLQASTLNGLTLETAGLGKILEEYFETGKLIGEIDRDREGFLKFRGARNVERFYSERGLIFSEAFVREFLAMDGSQDLTVNFFIENCWIAPHQDYPKIGSFGPFSDSDPQRWRALFKLNAWNPLEWFKADGNVKQLIVWDRLGVFYLSSVGAASRGKVDGFALMHGGTKEGANGPTASYVLDFCSNDPEEWIRSFISKYEQALAAISNEDPLPANFAPATVRHGYGFAGETPQISSLCHFFDAPVSNFWASRLA